MLKSRQLNKIFNCQLIIGSMILQYMLQVKIKFRLKNFNLNFILTCKIRVLSWTSISNNSKLNGLLREVVAHKNQSKGSLLKIVEVLTHLWKKMCYFLPCTMTSLSWWKRACKGRREGDNGLRLPSVPFPWSLAVHSQSLASTSKKTKYLRRRLLLVPCCH